IRDARGYAMIDGESGLTYRFTAANAGPIQPLTAIEDNSGHSIALRYDEGARLVHVVDSCGRVVQFVNDEHGRIVEILVPHPIEPGQRTTAMRFVYDSAGRMVEARDAGGHSTHYAYRGSLLVRETDAKGFSFQFEFDGEQAGARCIRTWGDGG